MVKPSIYDFLILILVGFILIVADRYLRIETFKNIENFVSEQPCGVYKLGLNPPRSSNTSLRCINGFYSSDNPPALKPNELPVFP
jgi:hypothetical protein